MYKFSCLTCKKTFEANGEKKEWRDSVVGPCHKYIAKCPDCDSECDEYRPSARAKKSVDNLSPPPACSSGTCGI